MPRVPVTSTSTPATGVRRRLGVIGAAATLATAGLAVVAPGASAQMNLALVAGVGQGTIAGQAYMPGAVTIGVGDSITITIDSDDPHTITMGEGPADIPPFAWPVSGFEAPPADAPPPYDLGTVSTDGTDFINTSILPGVGSSATIQFTAPGTFPVFCVIHPGMQAEITVVEDGPTTTQEEADAAGAETREFLLGSVEPSRQARLDATSVDDNGDGTQTWNIFADAGTPTQPLPGGGTGHLELLEFTPASLEIGAGDTVNWTASRIHTVTFLPPGTDPSSIFPSEEAAAAPMGGSTYDGTEPVNSGFLNVPGPEGQVVSDYSLTFPEPGEYPYFCAIHAGLGQLGVITVT